jgi:hypothetical protein
MVEDAGARAYATRVSCRALSPRPRVADLLTGTEAAELARDLAAADRRDDFRWFARSQGVPDERLDELWRHLRRPPAALWTR